MKENEGVLKIKTEVKNNCVNYDYFGLCSVKDCIDCENAVHRFIYSNGRQTGDNNYHKKGINEEKYLIEFFDKVPTRIELESYLLNPKSDYKITRLSDGVVLKYNNKETEEMNKTYEEIRKKQEENYKEYLSKVNEAKTRKKSTLILEKL